MASTPSSPDEDGVASTAATKDRKEIVTLAVYKWSKHELAQRCCHENGLSCSNGLCFEYISYIERDDRVGYTDLETRHGNRPNGIGANGTSRKSNAKVVSLKDYAERAKKKPIASPKMDKPSPYNIFANGSRLNLPIVFKIASPVHAPPPSDTNPEEKRTMDFHGEQHDYLSPVSSEYNRNKRPSPTPLDRPVVKRQRKETTPKPSPAQINAPPPPPPAPPLSPVAAKASKSLKQPLSLPKKPPPPEKPPSKQPAPIKLPILSPELPSVVEDALKADNMLELFGVLVSPTLPSVVEHFLVESEIKAAAKKAEKKEAELREKATKTVATTKSEKATAERDVVPVKKEIKKKETTKEEPEIRQPKKTATTATKTMAGKTLKKDKDIETNAEAPTKKTTATKTVRRDLETKETKPKSKTTEEFARKTVVKDTKPTTGSKTLKRSASLTFIRSKERGKDRLMMIWAYGKDKVDEVKAKLKLKRKRDPTNDFIPPAKKTKTEIPSPLPKKTTKVVEAASPISKKTKIEPASPIPVKKTKIEPASPLPAKKAKPEITKADAASPQPKKSWNEASSTPRTQPSSTTNMANGTPRTKQSVKDVNITPQKKRVAAVKEDTPKKSSEAHTPGATGTSRPSEPPPRKRVDGERERKVAKNPDYDKWMSIGRALKHGGEGKNISDEEKIKRDGTESRVKLLDSVLTYMVAFILDEESGSNLRALTANWEGTAAFGKTVVLRISTEFERTPPDDTLTGIAQLLEVAILQHIFDLDIQYMDANLEYTGDNPCRDCSKRHAGRCARYFSNQCAHIKHMCERLRNLLSIDVFMERFPNTWAKRARSLQPPKPKQASQGNYVCPYGLPVNIGPGVNLLEVVNVGYSLVAEYCKRKNIRFENRLVKMSGSNSKV